MAEGLLHLDDLHACIAEFTMIDCYTITGLLHMVILPHLTPPRYIYVRSRM